MSIRPFAFAILVALAAAPALAQADNRPATRPATAPAAPQKLYDRLAVTEHDMILNGAPLRYRATTGLLTARDEAGKDKANFFFVAYDRLGPDINPATRPITFIFNGGPGAAAVWMHMGTAGPKTIALRNETGDAPAPPYRLIDNDGTWLADTDLVFIDPVGTGYSRPAPGEKPEQFFGVREDVASVADFIRLYITRYQRWLSPKFLAGESYGTTRAAALSEHLLDRHGIALNGIIFISTVLDFRTLSFGNGNDLPYALYLPTYAATAWYHKRLAPELQEDLARTLREVEQFATGEYLDALFRGGALPADRRKALVAKLARYTALPADYIDKADLRIGPDAFRKMLLDDRRQLIGRFDARIPGPDPQPAQSFATYDPSLNAYLAAYSATFNDYVRTTLRFESELPYEVLTDRVQPWNYGRAGNGYLNVTADLRDAMVKLPFLRIHFASGYFDLATPYLATDYTVGQLAPTAELRQRIGMTWYLGGHMMYHYRPARLKLKDDVLSFIRSASQPVPQ